MKLYQHQVDVLNTLDNYNTCALYLDMGLGKTLVSSVKATSYNKPILIVVMKSLIGQWVEHIAQWHKDWEVYDLSKPKQFKDYLTSNEPKRLGIITYGLQWRRKDLQALKGYTLILDESHNICNPTSKQTKGIFKLKYDNLILCSGSPCSGAYEKLYTQYKLLGGKMNKKQYEDRYCNMFDMEVGGVKFRVLSKTNPYKNIGELKQWFRDNGAVFMKTEEVLDLPKQNHINIKCDSTKYYREFVKQGYTEYGDLQFLSDTCLNDMLNRRYLASIFNENKTRALTELLNSTDKKVVVFYNFTQELELIKNCLTDKKCYIVNGTVKQVEEFKRDGDVLLVQYQAGSTGLNLQFCDTIVYYSPCLRSDLFEQSKKRIHRIGQDRPCFYYYLVTRDSIEEKIYNVLATKQDYTERLFNNESKNSKR